MSTHDLITDVCSSDLAGGLAGRLLELGAGVRDDLAGEGGGLEVVEGQELGGHVVGLCPHEAELEDGLLADEVEGALLVVGRSEERSVGNEGNAVRLV